MPGQSFPRSQRVRKNWEFKRVYRKGRRFHHPAMTLVVGRGAAPAEGSQAGVLAGKTCRLGLSVSRKVGNAVIRNRIKRRLRDLFRRHAGLMKPGADLVVVPKPPSARLEAAPFADIFLSLCKKAGLMARGPS